MHTSGEAVKFDPPVAQGIEDRHGIFGKMDHFAKNELQNAVKAFEKCCSAKVQDGGQSKEQRARSRLGTPWSCWPGSFSPGKTAPGLSPLVHR